MRVLYLWLPGLLQPWYDDFRSHLEEAVEVRLLDPERPLEDQMEGVEVVVDQGGHGAPEVADVAAAAGVKLWQVLGTGLDDLDVNFLHKSGIRVANTPGPSSAVALAEHVLLFVLAFAKRLRESERNARSGTFFGPVNDDLEGAALGLVGFGASAKETAVRAAAFGMRLLAVDVREIPLQERERHRLELAGGVEALDRLIADSDYVSLHVPLTEATRGMIGRNQLAAMKQSAVLINVARGELVDEAALVEALTGERIRGAGLDVFGQEPLPPKHPLLELENVLLTPHIAGATRATSRRRGEMVAENVRRMALGLAPLHEVGRPSASSSARS